MYEHITFDVILERMMDRIPSDIDKREGSIIYDALAPAAVELAQMYIELDVILNETFADTASREYLIRRASERGLTVYPTHHAFLRGVFNIDVDIGTRFSLEDLNYVVTEKIEGETEYEYMLKCETVGVIGNKYFGRITPIEYVKGLASAELTELLIPGEEEEDTEHFRQRYFDSLNAKAYGGNIADYKEKVNAIQGVGGVKVYPVWNGGGTVKLVIINSDYRIPTSELINFVQTAVDPITNSGEGVGVAPIGHTVTVEAVQEQAINVELIIDYDTGYNFDSLKIAIEEVLENYLQELRKDWANKTQTIVRVIQIEARLLDLNGIIDVHDTKLNGGFGNLTLESEVMPILGVVSENTGEENETNS
ncbi:MAG: baseplate J/gp47 family protein [Bacillales bacterium]|nr:baseplate J/gp47 family protein [Bacillales bacterium]